VSADPRILGTGTFVEQLLNRDEERLRRTHAGAQWREQIEELIRKHARPQESSSVNCNSVASRAVAGVRAQLARQLIGDYGISLADAARRLGVSTSGIAKALERTSDNKYN